MLPFPQPASVAEPAPPRLLAELVSATSRRFAAFCAEAAVLVFVLGILDRFLIRNSIEPAWVAGAFLVSLLLLVMSIVTDVLARRFR